MYGCNECISAPVHSCVSVWVKLAALFDCASLHFLVSSPLLLVSKRVHLFSPAGRSQRLFPPWFTGAHKAIMAHAEQITSGINLLSTPCVLPLILWVTG